MKRDADVLLDGLRALQHQLLGAAASIEVILELADRPSAPSAPVTEPASNTPCPHPRAMRVPSPGMGHPHRFRCGACNEEVER